jgi:hypothetical protein
VTQPILFILVSLLFFETAPRLENGEDDALMSFHVVEPVMMVVLEEGKTKDEMPKPDLSVATACAGVGAQDRPLLSQHIEVRAEDGGSTSTSFATPLFLDKADLGPTVQTYDISGLVQGKVTMMMSLSRQPFSFILSMICVCRRENSRWQHAHLLSYNLFGFSSAYTPVTERRF